MASGSCLCLDLGNSRLKAQLRDGEGGGEILILAAAVAEQWPAQLAPLLAAAGGRAALCSVRPSQDPELLAGLSALGARVHCIRGESPVPFPVLVGGRHTLGADRLCNAAAAWAEGLAPALLIDAGTAVTVDWVDAEGRYRGGAILPGPGLCLEALARGGEQLFAAPPLWPPTPWGEDSAAALAAGALWGGLAALEGLARRYRADSGREAAVLLTGGGAPALVERWVEGALRWDPGWTLKGIYALAPRD